MPILEFKCSACGKVEEVIRLSQDNVPDSKKCGSCGKSAFVIFSRPNLNTEFPSQCGSARASMANFIDPAKKRGGLRGRLI